ncbi:hypothetical protein L0669_09965 [Flavobacterium bizetiae]|uniref:hypothetical protein n=1 Tax=Flavobacterium bizetiae TaxID=2704140 RepID=UPI0021E833CD|nr:hypothetical protein [Flavobacterium bizetiae]UTN06224.1 hypothetical protein L0669_09965 [Flavobacterium bizetiae]
MKKQLFLFVVAALTFASCSSDDNNTENAEDTILPKTLKYTDIAFPSENANYTFKYNGNKIVSTTDEFGRTDYTYDGDLIVKEVNYDTESVKGKDIISDQTTYTYANGKLVSSSYAEAFSTAYPDGQYRNRRVFTHNADGTIKVERYQTNAKTGVEEKSNYVEVLTFANGNLVKSVETNTEFNTSFTAVYEYDTKNNPLKNILGFSLLKDHSEGEGSLSSVNNVVKYTASYSVNNESSVYKRELTYNEKGYPVKNTAYKNDGITIARTNEYTY